MGRVEKLTLEQYADLVRRVVAFVQERQAQGVWTRWYSIRRRFRLTNDEIEMICGDSEVYGPKLMSHAQITTRGETTVEVLS